MTGLNISNRNVGDVITFGRVKNTIPLCWRIVSSNPENITVMLFSVFNSRCSHSDISKLLNDELNSWFDDDERNLIIPNRNNELLWIPSIYNIGIKVGSDIIFELFRDSDKREELLNQFSQSFWLSDISNTEAIVGNTIYVSSTNKKAASFDNGGVKYLSLDNKNDLIPCLNLDITSIS